MSFNPYKIIEAPILSEKSVNLKEKKQYTFRVSMDANKPNIKKAVETLFKVKVKDVKTFRVNGKYHRMGRYEGKRPDWKKAIVILKEGNIDFTELPK